MRDMTDRLARLDHPSGADTAPSDSTVAADLRRGRQALRRRNARRAGAGVVGVAAAATAIVIAVSGSSHPDSTPRADPRTSTPPTTSTRTTGTSTPPKPTAIKLVAYEGTQRPGFTVQFVPDGYVLQGVSGSTLDISEPDDHTSLDSFVGKLTVGIEEATDGQGLDAYHGRPVTINGQPGLISTSQYGTTLVFDQGHGSNNVVTVQCWKNITLTQDQVVAFAKGVTVTAAAQRQHG